MSVEYKGYVISDEDHAAVLEHEAKKILDGYNAFKGNDELEQIYGVIYGYIQAAAETVRAEALLDFLDL